VLSPVCLTSNLYIVIICLFPPVSCCLPQVFSSPVPYTPHSASCFSALLQAAYESQTLGDECVQTQLQDALPHLALHQALRSAKQVLLYLRSTVENFSQVSNVPPVPMLLTFHLQRAWLSLSQVHT
jgi:hypothetical protein